MRKHGAVEVKRRYFLHKEKLYVAQGRLPIVGDMHLYALYKFSFVRCIERLEMDWPEDDARYA